MAPHHHMTSFRICGKIFATAPLQGTHLHIFVDDDHRALALAAHPDICEKLWWGAKIMGQRVTLPKAPAGLVNDLLGAAWRHTAPKRLATVRSPHQ